MPPCELHSRKKQLASQRDTDLQRNSRNSVWMEDQHDSFVRLRDIHAPRVGSARYSISNWADGLAERGNSCTCWILQVGARMTEAALSFASGASNFKPISSTSHASHVAPRAVEDCQTYKHRKSFSKLHHRPTGRHLAGVLMKK
jgi:hypothetical protein